MQAATLKGSLKFGVAFSRNLPELLAISWTEIARLYQCIKYDAYECFIQEGVKWAGEMNKYPCFFFQVQANRHLQHTCESGVIIPWWY